MHVVALIQECLVEPPQGGTDSPEPCCFLQESLFLAEDKRTYIQGFDLHLGCKISAADGTVIRVTWLCCIVIACTPCQFLAADGLYRLHIHGTRILLRHESQLHPCKQHCSSMIRFLHIPCHVNVNCGLAGWHRCERSLNSTAWRRP